VLAPQSGGLRVCNIPLKRQYVNDILSGSSGAKHLPDWFFRHTLSPDLPIQQGDYMRTRAVGVVVGVVCVAVVVVLAVAASPNPSPQPVSVVNFPANQPVSGTVQVGNLPAVQSVAGTVQVANLPAVQEVAGTVGVGNLPVDSEGNLRVSLQGASSDYEVLSLLQGDVEVPINEVFESEPFSVLGFQVVGVAFDAESSYPYFGPEASFQWLWVDGGPFLHGGVDARAGGGGYRANLEQPAFSFVQGKKARISISNSSGWPFTVHSITVQLRK